MRRKRKILVCLGGGLLLFLCAFAAGLVLLLHSPGKVKTLVERSLSKATGAECSIRELSYSLNPLIIQAKGVQLIDHVQWFYLEIPELVTELSLQGPLGRKKLLVKRLVLRGLSLHTYRSFSLTRLQPSSSTTGFFDRLGRALVGLLLFREIYMEDAEISGGHMTSEIGDQVLTLGEIHVTLNEEKSLEIECYGRIRWNSEDTEMILPNIRLAVDHAISIVHPQIRMFLTSEHMTLVTPFGRAHGLSGQAHVVYDRDKSLLTLHSARVSSKTITLKKKNPTASPVLMMDLDLDGFVDFLSGRATAQHFHLVVHGVMEATGTLEANSNERPELRVPSVLLTMKLAPLWPLASDLLGLKRPPFEIGGVAHVHGSLHGAMEEQNWQWSGDMTVQVKEAPASMVLSGTSARGTVTADIRVQGLFPFVETLSVFSLDHATLMGKGVAVQSARASFKASGKGLDFDFEDAVLDSPHLDILLTDEPIRATDLRVRLPKGTILFSRREIHLPEIRLDSSLIKNLRISVKADHGHIGVGLQGKNLDLLSLARSLKAIPSDWQFRGLDSLALEAVLQENGRWRLDSRWNGDGLAYESSDSRFAGENIDLQLHLTAAGDRKGNRIEASLEADSAQGALVCDRMYLDLAKTPLRCRAEGNHDFLTGTTDLRELNIGLKDVLSLEAHALLGDLTLRKPYRFFAHIREMHIKPAFQLFLKDPWAQELPFLSQLEPGGVLLAEMEFEKQFGGWSLLGRCSVHGGEFLGQRFLFKGIELDLPFWIENLGDSAESSFRSGAPLPGNSAKGGRVFIESMRLPHAPEQSFDAAVQSTPNLLSLTARNPVNVLGGEIELGPVTLTGLSEFSPRVESSATLRGIDLEPLLFDVWSRSIPALMEGKVDFLHWNRGGIQTRGDLKISAYGGDVIVSNLGGSGLLTPTPMFALDAEWDRLRLGDLTQDTPFEKIEGILKGRVQNLEAAAGEPQRFDLSLETVPTEGTEQKISVRALESIAQIGGGGSPFLGLAGAFTSLFNEFPYGKIAIQASLENDVFTISGPLREGDKVYLVKRSGFSGVNVVNQNPDRRISFKDMLKRIRRISAPEESAPDEEDSTSEQQDSQ